MTIMDDRPQVPALADLPHELADLPSEELLDLLDEAAEHDRRQAQPENTRRAYTADWTAWAEFCAHLGVEPVTARSGLLTLYVKRLAQQQYRPSTVKRRLASVVVGLRERGVALPARGGPAAGAWEEVRAYGRRCAKERGAQAEDAGKAPALMPVHVTAMCRAVPPTLAGLRDKALMLLAVHIAARRSEMAAMRAEDVAEDPRGLLVYVRPGKDGRSRTVAVHYGGDPLTCPVRAWKAWRSAAGLSDGHWAFCPIRGRTPATAKAAPTVGLSGEWASRIIGCLGRLAGVDLVFTGHSARAGLITAAFESGADVLDVCAVSGHSPKSGTVYDYKRVVDRWSNTANRLS